MTPAEWRALLEAFVARRISPEAFKRRFMEGWRASRAAGGAPRAVEELFVVIEAYDPDQDFREDQAADEGELEQAAARALANLREDGAPAPRTYDRARAREDIGRFQIRVSQFAGVGCFIALTWVGLCLLQIFAVSEQVQRFFHWPAALATFVGVPLAFVPVVGNILAFLGATEAWHWNAWAAVLVFFAAPAATIASGWMRWWRR